MTVSVLFVCTANICRSPFMELWSRRYLAEVGANVEVASAGTHGFHGEPMAPEMRPVLERAGIETGSFRSRRLTGDMVAEADLVLTAEHTHRTFVLDSQPRTARKVLTLGQAAAAADQVTAELHGRESILELARLRSSADSSHDVDDPFRRGAEVGERAATTIVAMLTRVIPILC